MRVLVVGAGAVGGYFGARLAQAGREVTFLVRNKRAEQIRSNGFQLVRDSRIANVAVQTVTADQLDSVYDVILLTMPSFSLTNAMNDFAAAVGPSMILLPFLNEMKHMELLENRFGKASLLGGVCLVATELDKENRVVQLSDIQRLTYGELNGQITPRLEELHKVLSHAGFETFLSSSILHDMWNKWVQIASLGAVTCLLRGNIGQINETEMGRSTALRLLAECSSVTSAAGHPTPDAFPGNPKNEPDSQRVVFDIVTLQKLASRKSGRGRFGVGGSDHSRKSQSYRDPAPRGGLQRIEDL